MLSEFEITRGAEPLENDNYLTALPFKSQGQILFETAYPIIK